MGAGPRPEAHGEDEATREELARLRAEVRGLRTRTEGRTLIAQAQGMLRERYALPDAETAFALLQRASQQHNVKLRTLAGAALGAPRPHSRTGLWFPRRIRRAEPALGIGAAREPRSGRGNRSEVLAAVLDRTLAVVGTDMGNVQIADRTEGGLRIERHTGLTADFVDFFAYVGDDGTACAKAAREASQVTVRDVATDPVFTEEAREAILRAGSRACHSVPLTTASGLVVGMVSAHCERPLRDLNRAQTKELTAVGAQAGEWLAWYDRTVVLDALEHLHTLGRAHGGGGVSRR
ncbi:ANTAR domain-containing protein [Streptomyces sp. LBUM 1478]|uniref:ANTAR domain-containing protein n=8 Tax=Streptomyces scabiei TaxID=1930 RepID=C9YYU4_STRSW|nr:MULTISPECIES: ANTAR domain-containing protein [Streptomyces]MBP5909773.1 ANTAR domain-containing protein [Streptomyces sp. LBUM 1478]MBP5927012.1 ANTAR domain-containing protein [Streptomyces sp. LBUM 1479]MBP5889448.1 ANTAR domain-containing protein [Streptomyces sp. LBUM 1481]MBP5919477.1 ANTAR domain-containing protein [Streptomyces sp. LBUM 1483]MDX2536580.1 ANTAR domain-containing protein [Streptomyces scabiei]